jgi:transcriptional regulator with XRE-family HTH domain
MAQPYEEFGRFIKELRLAQKDMTQPDLARKLDKSASEVSRWEKGERRPKQASLLQLAMIFGVSIQVLQQKAGYTPEFDWYASFLGPKEGEEDILLTASDSEKKELRQYLNYLRFRSGVLKARQP